MNTPLISIVVPTFNEEKNIAACLDSIVRQNYPSNKVEIIIVDNRSSDNTFKIVKQYPVRFLTNNIRDTQISKRIGFEKSKGKLFMWFDADMRMSNNSWLKDMLNPLLKDESIVASIAGYITKGDESPLTRFLTLESKTAFGFSSQLDPIYRYFTTSLKKTVVAEESDYYICEYKKGKIPAQGLGVFRRDAVKKTLKHQGNKYMDLDILAHLVNIGYSRFAYVPSGVYHYFMPDLKTLIKKRIRNIKKNYIGQTFPRSYKWFDLSKPKDILKIFFWISYVHLIVPELIRGIYKTIRFGTWVGLFQPLVSLAETDAILVAFVYYYLKYKISDHL